MAFKIDPDSYALTDALGNENRDFLSSVIPWRPRRDGMWRAAQTDLPPWWGLARCRLPERASGSSPEDACEGVLRQTRRFQ